MAQFINLHFSDLYWGMPIMKYEGKYKPSQDGFHPLSFILSSRLLIFRGSPDDKDFASYFYEWTGSDLKLIRKVRAVRTNAKRPESHPSTPAQS